MNIPLIEQEAGKVLLKGAFSARQTSIWRGLLSIGLVALSVPLWRWFLREPGGGFAFLWMVGLTLDIVAFLLPHQSLMYIDLAGAAMVNESYYCGLPISQEKRPVSDFSRIVVRHICHPGREGPDTFTGSVGLKPADGSAVFWVKEFDATEDECPARAYEFADLLHTWTGLPRPVRAEHV